MKSARQPPYGARFYLDEDVPHSCSELGEALGDPVHLHVAAQDQRIMVTYNRDDFLAATRDAFASSGPHAGLLILTHRLSRDPARIVHALAGWVEKRKEAGAWPMQSYEVDFLSH